MDATSEARNEVPSGSGPEATLDTGARMASVRKSRSVAAACSLVSADRSIAWNAVTHAPRSSHNASADLTMCVPSESARLTPREGSGNRPRSGTIGSCIEAANSRSLLP